MKLLLVGDPAGTHSLSALSKYKPEDMWVWENDPRHIYAIKQNHAKINVIENLNSLENMHFTQSISNPPYKGQLHLEFLLKQLEISDAVKQIHPSGWLFRTTSSIEKAVKSSLKNRVKKLILFNGNAVFKGAAFACPLVITEAVKFHSGDIEVENQITGNTYYIKDLSEFPTGYWEPTKEHKDMVNLFKSLSNTNIYSLVRDTPTKPFLGCPKVVGHGVVREKFLGCPRVVGNARTNNPNLYATYDFHIFHYRNSNLDTAKSKVFKVNNEDELVSLKSYVKTKFARFGLSINKVSQDLYIKRYLDIVPLPPLDREWTDESLVEYYGLTKDQSEYIDSFIPDYY